MDLGLKNKRVVVQGSSSGLGFAIAKGFADEGAKVAICSTNEKRIKQAAIDIPGAIPFVFDLDVPGNGRRFVKDAAKALGGIDILVTNTGGPPKGHFADLTLQDWEDGFRRLWLSAIESILEALPLMKKQKFGRILFSTSTAAKEPISYLTVSNGLRSGLIGLMKTLSTEVGPYNITANAILPGYTRTARLAELKVSEEKLTSQIPMGRLAEPDEFAALAVFLGSVQASYITGQAIACDGGLIKGI
ncbi:MAG: SDR family oxidoreductase [Chlamydiota bacterium]